MAVHSPYVCGESLPWIERLVILHLFTGHGINNFDDTVEVLNSIVCKKVKNNQPLYPGKRFPTDIGKVYCHSLLNNNSGKHNDIYHIWYMNGNLKAKVRIRVREGQEIPAVSHREVASSDKGTWKIEITDSDKKILDTVIFEVV